VGYMSKMITTGYLGFRDFVSQSIVDDGVMDIVAKDWIVS
jgi:hypothetical protein